MMMRGMNTRLSTLFPVMISISMTHWPNRLTINFVPLHNPINWLRLRNKRIGMPTLSSSLWFVISLNCKVFRNSTGYNESIETLATTLAPSSVRVKEFVLKYMCDSLDNDSRIALLTSSMSVFLGAKMLRCIRYMEAQPYFERAWRWNWHSRNWDLGILWDSQNFKVQLQGSKHLALGCFLYHWKNIEV